jgi:hypothetical protein
MSICRSCISCSRRAANFRWRWEEGLEGVEVCFNLGVIRVNFGREEGRMGSYGLVLGEVIFGESFVFFS